MRDEKQYLADLDNATEIVLIRRRRVCANAARPRSRRAGGSSRAAVNALRLAHSVGNVLGSKRVLGAGETAMVGWCMSLLFALAAIAMIWPRLMAWPLAAVFSWIGVGLLIRYIRDRQTAGSPKS